MKLSCSCQFWVRLVKPSKLDAFAKPLKNTKRKKRLCYFEAHCFFSQSCTELAVFGRLIPYSRQFTKWSEDGMK